ncbi:aspartic proteinase CDR1-like [Pistacia vera]|uniref:aspartic proteinase CDR1-like n=1 Tax=Pistacia vera TaxID=55513 RepID=UPI001263C2A0|nr:aspartic proteinase CDR1-like [Pistacia vera]XP_031272894.1 aspartic proteinase CDR1-like [Pistacia vera]
MACLYLFLNIFFFTISIFIPPSTPHLTNSTNIDGFTVRLIHRNSHLSPFHNHSLTTSDRIRSAVHRSFSRLNRFHFLISPSLISDISPNIVPDDGEYFMTFYIGTPPRQVYALADTGSELTWVKCLPRKQRHEETPHTFDPSKSSSYKKLSCFSPSCNSLNMNKRLCTKGSCYYIEKYGDGLTTTGTLSVDKFSFEDDYKNAMDVDHLIFGCSDDASGPVIGNETGIVGLTRRPLSLVSQLNYTKFAYCMVIPTNNQWSGTRSKMYFGSETEFLGGQAPLVIGSNNQYYYLTLQGISVGDEKLQIPSGIFDITENGQGGFIIDSGTTYTLLQGEAFDALVNALSEAINLPQRRNYGEELELCFEGSFEDLVSQPDVTFHLNATDLILTKETTYEEVETGVWCLAILRSKNPLSILGNVQQRNYYVSYDLRNGTEAVYFAPVDCAVF